MNVVNVSIKDAWYDIPECNVISSNFRNCERKKIIYVLLNLNYVQVNKPCVLKVMVMAYTQWNILSSVFI